MSNQLKYFLKTVIFLSVVSFSYGVHANMEISAYGGRNFHKELKLSEINLNTSNTGNAGNKEDHQGHSWLFGFDVVYRGLLDTKCGLGLRYQHNTIRGADYGRDNQMLNFNANRLAILGSYRFLTPDDVTNKGLFLGVLGAWDLLRTMSIHVDATGGGVAFELKSTKYFGLTGQLAVEVGYRWTPSFFMKAEAGYSLYSFNAFEACDGDRKCAAISNEEDQLSLNAPYVTLGIGWFFI